MGGVINAQKHCFLVVVFLVVVLWGGDGGMFFKSTVKIKKLLVSKKGDIFLTQIQFSIDSCEISGDCFRWHLLYCESVSFSLRQFLQFY